MLDIKSDNSSPIDSDALIEFRVVSMTDGEFIAGQEIHWDSNSAPDGTSTSDKDGWVRKSYSSGGMVGYKSIRAYILDESEAVMDQEQFRIHFYDPELP